MTGPSGVEGLTYGIRSSFYDRQESKPTYSESLPLSDGLPVYYKLSCGNTHDIVHTESLVANSPTSNVVTNVAD